MHCFPFPCSIKFCIEFFFHNIFFFICGTKKVVAVCGRRLAGKNRRVNISINLVIIKNLLLKELESVADPEKW